MKGTLWKLALASSLATLAIPPDAFAGRGGGARGGYGGGGGATAALRRWWLRRR